MQSSSSLVDECSGIKISTYFYLVSFLGTAHCSMNLFNSVAVVAHFSYFSLRLVNANTFDKVKAFIKNLIKSHLQSSLKD